MYYATPRVVSHGQTQPELGLATNRENKNFSALKLEASSPVQLVQSSDYRHPVCLGLLLATNPIHKLFWSGQWVKVAK